GSHLLQLVPALLQPGDGSFARAGFDAARAGSYSRFFGDDEQTDQTNRADVNAAAQFFQDVADADETHLVAVFFSEQHHGAFTAGFFHADDAVADRQVPGNPVVDELLHAGELPGSGRFRTAEIKAQPAGADEQTCLDDVATQHF